jgi:hypothetical protein
VQASGTSLLPGAGHGGRIVTEHGLALEVTLAEADTAAATDVNGWDYLHASPKLAAAAGTTAARPLVRGDSAGNKSNTSVV